MRTKCMVFVAIASVLINPRLVGMVASAYFVSLVLWSKLKHGCLGSQLTQNLCDLARVSAASLAGLFFISNQIFVGCSILVSAIVLNDEGITNLLERRGLIVLSGTDSVGKSTNSKRICQVLKNKNLAYRLVSFDHSFLPFVSTCGHDRQRTGKFINSMSFLKPYLAFFMIFCRYTFSIQYSLFHGEICVCDRFLWDSAIKYSTRGFWIKYLTVASTLVKPKIALILDANEYCLLDRHTRRGDHNFLTFDLIRKERIAYHQLANKLRIPIIDTGKTKDHVWNQIQEILNQKNLSGFPLQRRI